MFVKTIVETPDVFVMLVTVIGLPVVFVPEYIATNGLGEVAPIRLFVHVNVYVEPGAVESDSVVTSAPSVERTALCAVEVVVFASASANVAAIANGLAATVCGIAPLLRFVSTAISGFGVSFATGLPTVATPAFGESCVTTPFGLVAATPVFVAAPIVGSPFV